LNSFDLIIFDCDGVLVDSERVANQVLARILKEECGLSYSLAEMFETFVGRSMQQCMEIIEQQMGTTPPAGLKTRFKQDINNVLAASVTAVQGIEQALAEISIPYCVASSGSHHKMRLTLGKTQLLKHFEGKLHSSSDVKRGKPFPDIYLHAAQNMGYKDPSRCLVIEDSPPGIQGGVAAGMVVFGFAELMDEQRLIQAGAHHTFTDMRRLTDEISHYTHKL